MNRETHPDADDPALRLAPENLAFVRSALAYLMLSGAILAAQGELLPAAAWRPAVLHSLTLGFMLMLIFGLGAHMLPRFTGHPLRLGLRSWLQFGLAHAGIGAFLLGWVLERPSVVLGGACLVWLALLLFVLRVLPLLWTAQNSASTGA